MTGHQPKIADYFQQSATNFVELKKLSPLIETVAKDCAASLQKNGHLFFCGNGGSAADSQHIAAELIGRFMKERRSLPGTALTTNSSTLTAIGNDYGYDEVFARQVEGLAKAGDILFAISTSGNSKNVIKAILKAKSIGVKTVGLTGAKGGQMAELCDMCIRVPSDYTPHIQEMHIATGHMICQIIDDILFE